MHEQYGTEKKDGGKGRIKKQIKTQVVLQNLTAINQIFIEVIGIGTLTPILLIQDQ